MSFSFWIMWLRMITRNSSWVVITGRISLISRLSNIPLYISTTSLSVFSLQIHLSYILVEDLLNREVVNIGVPVSSRFLFFPRYTSMSASALCSVAHFLDALVNTIDLSRVTVGNIHFHYKTHRAPFSPCPVLHFWCLYFMRTALLTDAKWYVL